MRHVLETLLALSITFGLSTNATAQSIGDYSKAQRAALEASILKTSAPPVGSAAVPLPSFATPSTTPVPPSPLDIRSVVEPRSPELALVGVVILPNKRLAELQVRDAAHVVGVGDEVPGTRWVVRAVEARQVVLAAPGRSGPGKSESIRRLSFAGGDGQ